MDFLWLAIAEPGIFSIFFVLILTFQAYIKHFARCIPAAFQQIDQNASNLI